jgi:hypothetical protein
VRNEEKERRKEGTDDREIEKEIRKGIKDKIKGKEELINIERNKGGQVFYRVIQQVCFWLTVIVESFHEYCFGHRPSSQGHLMHAAFQKSPLLPSPTYDQQQHSCEMLTCQSLQTILRLFPSAAAASTRW